MKSIKYPVKYDSMGQSILDADNNIICDVRGWGRFQYMKDAEAMQDEMGKFIAEAINQKLNTLENRQEGEEEYDQLEYIRYY